MVISHRFDAYTRVSRKAGRGGESYISFPVQREQIEGWVAKKGDVEIVEWHQEEDESGATTNRPLLQLALERVELRQTDGIVVAKLDRFARSLTGALEAIKRIIDAGGTFISVQEGIDPTTPQGKMQQHLMLVFAEYELDRIRESWRVARQRAVERGVHIASRSPTGYRRRSDGMSRTGFDGDRFSWFPI